MQILQERHFLPSPSTPTRQRGSQRQAVFRIIVQTFCTEGQAPSMTSIQQALGIRSSGTVHYHLQQLEERGWLRRVSGTWRDLIVPILSSTRSQAPEAVLRPISLPFQDISRCMRLRLSSHDYLSEHLCAGDVITVTPGVFVEGLLLAVVRCPLQSYPSLTLVQIQEQNTDILSLRLVEHGNSPSASLQLSAEEWHRDWVVLGAVASVSRSI